MDAHRDLYLLIANEAFRESIAPAVLDNLGGGVIAIPTPNGDGSYAVRVKGRFVTIRRGETQDAIIDRIHEVWNRTL